MSDARKVMHRKCCGICLWFPTTETTELHRPLDYILPISLRRTRKEKLMFLDGPLGVGSKSESISIGDGDVVDFGSYLDDVGW